MSRATDKIAEELKYDNTFQKGDLITAYQKGYFIFDRYEDRGPMNPLVYYHQAFDSSGNSRKSKREDVCDAIFCRRADKAVIEEIQKMEETIARLRKMMLPYL